MEHFDPSEDCSFVRSLGRSFGRLGGWLAVSVVRRCRWQNFCARTRNPISIYIPILQVQAVFIAYSTHLSVKARVVVNCNLRVQRTSSFVRSFVLSFVCWGANLFVFIYQVSSFNGTENGLRSVSRGTQTQSTYLVVDKSKESVFGIWYYGKP